MFIIICIREMIVAGEMEMGGEFTTIHESDGMKYLGFLYNIDNNIGLANNGLWFS